MTTGDKPDTGNGKSDAHRLKLDQRVHFVCNHLESDRSFDLFVVDIITPHFFSYRKRDGKQNVENDLNYDGRDDSDTDKDEYRHSPRFQIRRYQCT
jgi:hypothetical protein